METTHIQCPNCSANIAIQEDSASVVCPDCGRILLIEHVSAPVRAAGETTHTIETAPATPLSREDKIAGVGLMVLILAVLCVFLGLTLKIHLVWLIGGLLAALGIGLSLVGVKGDRKERFAASMLVAFIAAFFILMGLLYKW